MTQIWIIVIYLGLLVAVGLISAQFFRGTSRDFFVVSRSIGPFLLLMSVFGTTMTAFAMVGSSGGAFKDGIAVYGKVAGWSVLLHSAVFFFIGMKLWAFGKRYGHLTQIQFFRARFESDALGYVLFPVLVGLVIPYLLVGLLGAGATVQGVTRGALPEVFTSTGGAVPPWLTSGIICLVVMSYVFAGGMRSAAWANAFQTCIFMVMAVVAFWMIAQNLGGMNAATLAADDNKFIREGNVGQLEYFTYFFIPLSVAMFPHLFQHWLTAKRAKTFRLTLIAHPIFIMITWIPCILIGIWATGAMTPDGMPLTSDKTPANAVLGIMVKNFTTPVLSGLVTAGVLAAIMSSLDSQFVALGTMFTQDVVVKAAGKKRFSDRQIIWLARGFIAGIVLLTWIISLFAPKAIFPLGVWCFTGFAALFPIVFVALYWKRATAAGVIAGILATAVTWIIFFTWSNVAGTGRPGDVLLWGINPVAYIFGACALAVLVVSLVTRPPTDETVAKYFPKKNSS